MLDVGVQVQWLARLQVAVGGGWGSGTDAEGVEGPAIDSTPGGRDQAPSEFVHRLDQMVRGHRGDDTVSESLPHQGGRQADGGGRVPAQRLSHDVVSRDLGKLLSNQGNERLVGEDQDPFPVDEPFQTEKTLLEQALLVHQAEELLGPLGRAERPETGSGAAGHDDSYQVHPSPPFFAAVETRNFSPPKSSRPGRRDKTESVVESEAIMNSTTSPGKDRQPA